MRKHVNKERCTRIRFVKCNEVCLLYDKVQRAYAEHIDKDKEVKSFEVTPEANLLRAIDSGLLGETNIHEREGGATETHSVEDGADEHTCPVCGAYLSAEDEEIWKDGSLSDVGDGYIYRLHCPKCNADISQVYHLDFCGFVVE